MVLESHVAALRSANHPRLVVELDRPEPHRVALLPGSFDPITIAHAALADAGSEWADLVVALYSVRTMPKDAPVEAPLLSERERLRCLESFCGSRPTTEPGLCSHGLLVDQVRAASERFPRVEPRLVIGSDKLLQLLDPTWYTDRDTALDQLFGGAAAMYAVREGDAEALAAALADPVNERWLSRMVRLDVAPDVAAVSSSLVRSLLRRGQAVRHLVPPEVVPQLSNVGIEA